MLEACEQAAELLSARGIQATVWDPRAVKPLDDVLIADAARHPLVVTVEDGLRDGGAGSLVAAAIGSQDPGQRPPVRVLGIPCAYIPHGKPDAILAKLGLDAEGIASEVREALETR